MKESGDGREILKQGNTDLCEIYYDDTRRSESLKAHMPGEHAFQLASLMLKAGSDPARAKLLYALTHSELCVGEMVELTDMRISTVLRHVKILRNVGLIQPRRQGRKVFYQVRTCYLTDVVERIVNSCRGKSRTLGLTSEP